jgi:WD40 repeat protein
VKLWDARVAEKSGLLLSLRHHKQAVSKVQWNRNGTWLLTCGADGMAHVFDIRTCKQIYSAATAAGITAAQCVPVQSLVCGMQSRDVSLQMAPDKRARIRNRNKGITRHMQRLATMMINLSSHPLMQAAPAAACSSGPSDTPTLCFKSTTRILKISATSPTIPSAPCFAPRAGI